MYLKSSVLQQLFETSVILLEQLWRRPATELTMVVLFCHCHSLLRHILHTYTNEIRGYAAETY
jgi:hypothetical protein